MVDNGYEILTPDEVMEYLDRGKNSGLLKSFRIGRKWKMQGKAVLRPIPYRGHINYAIFLQARADILFSLKRNLKRLFLRMNILTALEILVIIIRKICPVLLCQQNSRRNLQRSCRRHLYVRMIPLHFFSHYDFSRILVFL